VLPGAVSCLLPVAWLGPASFDIWRRCAGPEVPANQPFSHRDLALHPRTLMLSHTPP
jgi:hypothetical protein